MSVKFIDSNTPSPLNGSCPLVYSNVIAIPTLTEFELLSVKMRIAAVLVLSRKREELAVELGTKGKGLFNGRIKISQKTLSESFSP